jgi:hypothetical protein
MHVAFFVSAHGLGHAARAAAVMAGLQARHPWLQFEVFSQVPRWFFEASLAGPFTHSDVLTDIGLVQTSPLHEDLPQTVQRLNEFLPLDEARVAALARQVRGCALVMCDISPLGIAVARAAGLPSVLIENFTWDWIYEGYVAEAPGLRPHIDYLRQLFASAHYHVQTAPACDSPYPAHLLTQPVSRSPRTPAAQVRERLGISAQARAVLVTMGGIAAGYSFLDRLGEQAGLHFVVPGGSDAPERRANCTLLPHRSEFYHPDLVSACDVLVGKVGYSTLAEAYHAGTPCGYVRRARFREASVLVDFMRAKMQGFEISADRFADGGWLADLPDLLTLPRVERRERNGAGQVAEFVSARLHA